MSSLNTFLSKNNIEVIRNEQTTFPDGEVKTTTVCYLPTALLKKNPKNNRFRSKKGLSDAEQSKLLRENNPTNFNSLVKSIKDQPCFEAIKVSFNGKNFDVIDGHRRLEATVDAGRADFLAMVYEGLNEEQYDFVAEWNEENPTKLPHEAFYKARGIALPILEASSDEERKKIMDRLKRRNIKQAQIDKAVETCLYITDFSQKVGEPEEKRADQYKAFETVVQTRGEKFQTLRNLGEYDKVEKLDLLAIDFLKGNIAHDDIKAALDGLADRGLEDPLWARILEKKINTEQVSDLRTIVNEIRWNKSTVDIVSESKSFCQRIYGKLLSNPSHEVVQELKAEFEMLLEKVNLVGASCGGVQ